MNRDRTCDWFVFPVTERLHDLVFLMCSFLYCYSAWSISPATTWSNSISLSLIASISTFLWTSCFARSAEESILRHFFLLHLWCEIHKRKSGNFFFFLFQTAGHIENTLYEKGSFPFPGLLLLRDDIIFFYTDCILSL